MSEILSIPQAGTTQTPPDLAAVKARQQATWASGDFAVIGTTLQIVGESLCEAVDVEAGTRVLDVACGNGNATLAAARRGGRVVGIDYVPALLQRAEERARAERLEVELVSGDAEHLPFGDGEFDVALSTFGVMFAPDHPQSARELMRVVRPGGRIGLANWTPDGFIGQLLKTVGRHVPPPAGVASPSAWGDEGYLKQLFRGTQLLQVARKEFVFRYRSSAEFVDVFRTFYGPTHVAFGKLDRDAQQRLAADITDLCDKYNRKSGSFAAPGEYLEIVIER